MNFHGTASEKFTPARKIFVDGAAQQCDALANTNENGGWRMRNQYPGICYRCGDRVEAGAGHFERHPSVFGNWRTQHADCAIRWRAKPAPTMAEARAARRLKATS